MSTPHYKPDGTPSASIESLSALLGAEGVDQLCAKMGGRRVYVPTTIPSNHPLGVILGAERAALLAAYFSGVLLTVPAKHDRKQRILDLAGQGYTKAEIAATLNLTERWVYRVLSAPRNDAQLTLF